MNKENRGATRYKEIGHVNCNELCALPGVLDDISDGGCKIHYEFPVVVDLENEYELKILPSQNLSERPLNLRCVPQWVNENEGTTSIGFKIQYSLDAARLKDFIAHLEQLASDDFSDNK